MNILDQPDHNKLYNTVHFLFIFGYFRLQVGEVVTTIPTIGFNVEQVTYKNLKFQVWDLGGQTSIRCGAISDIYRMCLHLYCETHLSATDISTNYDFNSLHEAVLASMRCESFKNLVGFWNEI